MAKDIASGLRLFFKFKSHFLSFLNTTKPQKTKQITDTMLNKILYSLSEFKNDKNEKDVPNIKKISAGKQQSVAIKALLNEASNRKNFFKFLSLLSCIRS